MILLGVYIAMGPCGCSQRAPIFFVTGYSIIDQPVWAVLLGRLIIAPYTS